MSWTWLSDPWLSADTDRRFVYEGESASVGAWLGVLTLDLSKIYLSLIRVSMAGKISQLQQRKVLPILRKLFRNGKLE